MSRSQKHLQFGEGKGFSHLWGDISSFPVESVNYFYIITKGRICLTDLQFIWSYGKMSKLLKRMIFKHLEHKLLIDRSFVVLILRFVSQPWRNSWFHTIEARHFCVLSPIFHELWSLCLFLVGAGAFSGPVWARGIVPSNPFGWFLASGSFLTHVSISTQLNTQKGPSAVSCVFFPPVLCLAHSFCLGLCGLRVLYLQFWEFAGFTWIYPPHQFPVIVHPLCLISNVLKSVAYILPVFGLFQVST